MVENLYGCSIGTKSLNHMYFSIWFGFVWAFSSDGALWRSAVYKFSTEPHGCVRMLTLFCPARLIFLLKLKLQRRIVRRKFVNADVRFRWWRPSSSFGAEQRICQLSCSLAVQTGRHRGKNTRETKLLARSACRYLQPTGNRMVTPLPTESSLNVLANEDYITYCKTFRSKLKVIWYASYT